MHPLGIYEYHVRYGSSLEKQKEYDIIESVCFSKLFSSDCKDKYYQIIILKGEADFNKYYSNYCFFNKREIINHLKQIPKFCKMSFRVSDTNYKGDDAFKIDFYINSNNRLIHKYVLTWIRTLFEWPFYLFLLHAKKLKQLPQFKFESIVNLFNVIATTYRNSFRDKVHSFGSCLGLLKKTEIANNIKKYRRVNDVFPTLQISDECPRLKLISDFDDITDKLFEASLPCYLETYEIVKHESSNLRKRQ